MLCPVPDAEAAPDAPHTKEEPQTDDAEGKGATESEPGSAPAEPPLSEAEAKTSGDDEQAGGGASAEDADDDGEEKMDTDD